MHNRRLLRRWQGRLSGRFPLSRRLRSRPYWKENSYAGFSPVCLNIPVVVNAKTKTSCPPTRRLLDGLFMEPIPASHHDAGLWTDSIRVPRFRRSIASRLNRRLLTRNRHGILKSSCPESRHRALFCRNPSRCAAESHPSRQTSGKTGVDNDQHP
jgi:hypothetical protein